MSRSHVIAGIAVAGVALGLALAAPAGVHPAAAATAVPAAPPAPAAGQTGTSSAFKGFGSSKDPISIDADNLGVAGPDQIVTITGNVVVKQKDSTLYTQLLKVFYENQPGATPAPGADPTTSGTQLKRFEAYQGVKITQPDQTVSGDTGWFDMQKQLAEVTGNVILTQCKNIARGSRLTVNLKTGEYHLFGDKGRVIILLNQTKQDAADQQTKCK